MDAGKKKELKSDAKLDTRSGTEKGKSSTQYKGPGSAGVSQSEVLIEGEFIELDDQLWLDKQVRILVTSEFVYVTEHGTEREINSQAHVLQHGAGKTVFKYRRSDIKVELLEGCSYTFKAKWTSRQCWRTYRLCGKLETWRKWLRCFHLQSQRQQWGLRLRENWECVASIAIAESDDDGFSSSSESEDEGEESGEVAMPNRVSLCVEGAMSSMLSMTMLNPSNVRRIAINNLQHQNKLKRSSLGTIGSENEDVFESCNAGELFRSSSHPRLSDTQPFCTFSLMNLNDLDIIKIDQDLRERSLNTDQPMINGSVTKEHRVRGCDYRVTSFCHAYSAKEVLLCKRIENLRSHPSNLNFVRRHLWGKTLSMSTSPAHNRRLSLSLALTSESHRIPQSAESILSGNSTQNRILQQEISTQNHVNNHIPSSHLTTGVPTHRLPTARRLDFSDEMDINDQKPQKAKVRRFWTMLNKKRTRNRPSLSELDEDAVKELKSEAESSAVPVVRPHLRRGKSFSGVVNRNRSQYSDGAITQSEGKKSRFLDRGGSSRMSFSSSPTRTKTD